MLQPRPVPALSFVQRIRADGRSRALGVGLTLLIQLLLLFVLVSLGTVRLPGVDERTNVVSLRVQEVAEDTPETRAPEPEQQQEERRDTQRPEPEEVQPPQPAEPVTTPVPPPVVPPLPQLAPSAAPPRASPPAQPRPVYGPPDTRPAAARDTERVGTAPNGEPLYAAAWYSEPSGEMLRGYLSTAHGPGWGLIACRTAPNYRVEDCVALDEYPNGSQINRAVLAAAWEFRVRPPRRGGQLLVGAWVRIRIDYGIERR